MKSANPLLLAETSAEISALIETLHKAEQRLEKLTAGEVDTVADQEGHTFLLRRAQDRLRHDEELKQSAVLNALPANIALLDVHGVIISVNEAWRQFARANALQGPGYAVGVNYLEICDNAQGQDSAEAREVAAGIRAVLSENVKSYTIEYPCHSPTERRWFSMTVTPLSDEHPNGVVVMHVNITQRKETEATNQRLVGILESTSDFVSISDPDGHLVYLNRAARCALGVDPQEDIAQTTIAEFIFDPIDNLIVTEGIPTAIRQGTWSGESILLSRQGQKIPVSQVIIAHKNPEGKLNYLSTIMRDITKRILIEQTLQRQQTELRLLFDLMPAMIWFKDTENGILRVNERAAEAAGKTVTEIEGKPSVEIYPENAAKYFADDLEVIQSGVPKLGIIEMLPGPDGEQLWVQTDKVPYRNKEGEVIGIVVMAQDITERRLVAQELRESERRFYDLLQNVELVSLMLDCEGRITFCNAYLLHLTGWRREEVIGRNWFELFIPPESNDLKAEFAEFLVNPPDAWHHENEILTRLGKRRLIRWNNSVLRSGAGDVLGTASIGEDISEQSRAETKIKRLNRVYAVLSGINTLIVRVADREQLFKEACRIAVVEGAFMMAWIGTINPLTLDGKVVAWHGGEAGYVDEVVLTAREGTPYSERPACRALRHLQPVICNDIATEPSMFFRDRLLKRGFKSAGYFPLTVAGRPVAVLALFASETDVFDGEETRLLRELANDISFALDHIEKEEKLKYLAYYDVLTGLANRTLFHERLEQDVINAKAQGRKLALVLVDIERFKTINDTLGRQAGDALLKAVVARMTNFAADASRLGRLEADHFAVMVTEPQAEEELARLIEQCVAEIFGPPLRVGDAELRLTAKFGIAMFPGDGTDADTLFRNAEAALKNAKVTGERYLFYTPTMNEHVAEKLTLENKLRQAIEKREFVLYYQPKVNLASGKLTSAEALIRWNDPQTGLVPPGRFIPILEETGLIYEVGRWALGQAIADYLRWRAAGLAVVRIAVNVSPLQLRDRGFIAEVERAISADAYAAAGLELEITESLIMEDIKHNIASLQAIRDLGVTIAIDDFGTGFSSLSYLSKLPVDTLKIDRSFVIDMTSGPEGLALVSTIIDLAHAMKLKVVAEGVETEEQSRLLRLLNCDEMQGYLFSKPVPSEIFETRFLTALPPGDD